MILGWSHDHPWITILGPLSTKSIPRSWKFAWGTEGELCNLFHDP
jgi:hypothetical protein